MALAEFFAEDGVRQFRLRLAILVSDFIILVGAVVTSFAFRFGEAPDAAEIAGPIQIVGSAIPLFWILVLVALGAYDDRILGLGLNEYGRILQSAIVVIAVVSMVSFLGKFDTSRFYVLGVVLVGLVGLLIERWLWRRLILRWRMRGLGLEPTLIIGGPAERESLRVALAERPWTGYRCVGEFPGPVSYFEGQGAEGSSEAWLDSVENALQECQATCIALTGSDGVDNATVRDVSWRFEGYNLDLLLGTSLGNVTGPRISLRVASGLPLVHLDEVGLRDTQRFAKRALDLVGATALLILLSPLLLLIAVSIGATSGRPILFRQLRAGRDGVPFRIWKFRTMVLEADLSRDELRAASESSGPSFKMTDDPRVTRFGRFLRRWSLDELPQLVNVIAGNMSLVGPRPHPFDDVRYYATEDFRRLIAKPGMTGLWQVAGRSDLSWDDGLEMDLLYIENWSFVGDITILFRTFQAVATKGGAY